MAIIFPDLLELPANATPPPRSETPPNVHHKSELFWFVAAAGSVSEERGILDAGSILEVVSKSTAPLPEITASCGATKEAC
ncbi:hypothetical protein HPS10_05305 [Glaesserella parasuis HPS10]|uniref:Uncharacterized protein n=1 Tax=Glaesserella parasuis HPS10 TaxID=1450514 RepID=A0A836MED7_GLAPU|nr:hypothetical protein HPS10_05305 [Glaesserella parasuis HPS10]